MSKKIITKILDNENVIYDYLMNETSSFVNKKEIQTYRRFSKSKSGIIFDEFNFGERIKKKKSIIKNFFYPFIFENGFVKFYKLKSFDVLIIDKDGKDYQRFSIEMSKEIYYIDNFESHFLSMRSLPFIVKFVSNKTNGMINEKEISIFKSNVDMKFKDDEVVFIPKNMDFLIRDIRKIIDFGQKRISISIADDFVVSAVKYIENNKINRSVIAKIAKRDGLSSDIFRHSLQFSKANIKNYFMPSMKWRSFDMVFVGKAVISMLENQDSVDYEILTETMNLMTGNKEFRDKIKTSKKIKKKFEKNEGALLLIQIY
jgi:hypothetical protein